MLLLRHRRTVRQLAAIVVTLLSFAAPGRVLAAPKDKAAEKLLEQAMDEDYLNTDFDSAIDKLEKALKTCGDKGCSKEVLGRIHVAMGVVYGGGKSDMGKAKASFTKAIQADPNAKPLEDFMTSELKKAFEEAKQGAGTTTEPKPPEGDDDDEEAAGDINWSAPNEAAVNTPLPLYIELPEDLGATKVSLRYKPFGSSKWLSEDLRRVGKGWGGMIPCKELTTTGALQVRILVTDDSGDLVASAGTRRKPHTIQIKHKIEGKQPSLPGKAPPQKCATAADCPPDFPGCAPAGGDDDDDGERGDKGWGASCEETKECRSGLICLNGSCEPGEGDDDDDDGAPSGEGKHLFASIGVQLDLLAAIGSADDVCGVFDPTDNSFQQKNENYFCFTDDGEFLGKPVEGKFNQVEGGVVGLPTVRLLAGFDGMVWSGAWKGSPELGGLGVGMRIGYAFLGSPSVGDAEDRFNECKETREADGDPNTSPDDCREPSANDFFGLHFEILRLSYFIFGSQGFANGLVRPYIFAGGGFASVNAGVPVAVCDTLADDGAPVQASDHDESCNNDAGVNATKRDVEAYHITGLNFVNFGVGAYFALHESGAFEPGFGINAELKAMYMFPPPTDGFTLGLAVGPALMF